MNWKKWKVGLAVAIIAGIASGLIGLAAGITWKAFWILMGVNVGKDMLLFIKSNPIEQVSFETSQISRNEVTGVTTSQASKTTVTTDSSKL